MTNSLLDAWQSSDPYSDSTAQSIGYAMLKDNTVWSSGFNNIVFKKNGIYWETLTGSNTYTGYKYLAQTATYNGYNLNVPAIIFSGELFVKQAYSFVNGSFNVLMNIGKSKFYWYYNASNYGKTDVSSVRASLTYSSRTFYDSYRHLSQFRWSNTLPLINYKVKYWSVSCGMTQGVNWDYYSYSTSGATLYFGSGVIFYLTIDEECS